MLPSAPPHSYNRPQKWKCTKGRSGKTTTTTTTTQYIYAWQVFQLLIGFDRRGAKIVSAKNASRTKPNALQIRQSFSGKNITETDHVLRNKTAKKTKAERRMLSVCLANTNPNRRGGAIHLAGFRAYRARLVEQ